MAPPPPPPAPTFNPFENDPLPPAADTPAPTPEPAPAPEISVTPPPPPPAPTPFNPFENDPLPPAADTQDSKPVGSVIEDFNESSVPLENVLAHLRKQPHLQMDLILLIYRLIIKCERRRFGIGGSPAGTRTPTKGTKNLCATITPPHCKKSKYENESDKVKELDHL